MVEKGEVSGGAPGSPVTCTAIQGHTCGRHTNTCTHTHPLLPCFPESPCPGVQRDKGARASPCMATSCSGAAGWAPAPSLASPHPPPIPGAEKGFELELLQAPLTSDSWGSSTCGQKPTAQRLCPPPRLEEKVTHIPRRPVCPASTDAGRDPRQLCVHRGQRLQPLRSSSPAHARDHGTEAGGRGEGGGGC